MTLRTGSASLNPKPGDVVLHYKGGLYLVLLIALDEESMEERVIYMECKPPKARAKRARVFDRRISDWIKPAKQLSERFSEPRYLEVLR